MSSTRDPGNQSRKPAPCWVWSLAGIQLVVASSVFAGARVDLVPDQAGPYAFGDTIRVSVFLSRTDPGADILLRSVLFDLEPTDVRLTVVLPIIHPGSAAPLPIAFWDFGSMPSCANNASNCGYSHFVDDDLAGVAPGILSITYSGTSPSLTRQIRLPGDGTAIRIGVIDVTIPAESGAFVLDVLNPGSNNADRGGELRFGFGVQPDDPVTTWRAEFGEITGGTLIFQTTDDCNGNGMPDLDDVIAGTSVDCNADHVPDECQPDSDADGVIDDCDGCVLDPLKTKPLVCGCGTPDVDVDADEIPECAAGILVVPVRSTGPHRIVDRSIVLAPGRQVVTLEVYAAEWSRRGYALRAYQLNFREADFTGGSPGRIRLIDGRRECGSDADCADLRVPCRVERCMTSVESSPGAFVDNGRLDFVFLGGAIGAIDFSFPGEVRIGIALENGSNAPVYAPPPKYLCTLRVDVSADALGTFLTGPHQGDGTDTFLIAEAVGLFIKPLALIPAEITIRQPICGNGVCGTGETEASCPQDCVIEVCGNGVCGTGEDELTCPADCFVAPPPEPVPSVSGWGVVVLTLLLAVTARVSFGRRRETASR